MTHHEVEYDLPPQGGILNSLKPHIIDLGVGEVVPSRGDADVDLAGEVGEVLSTAAAVCDHILQNKMMRHMDDEAHG